MTKTMKKVLASLAALAALALGASAIAGAASTSTTGSTTSSSTPAASTAPRAPAQGAPSFNGPAPGSTAHEDAEKPVTGEAAEKAQAAAVKYVGSGTAGAVTTDYTKTGYETTVTKSDGTKVEVHLDSSFTVLQGPPGGPHGPGAPSGTSGQEGG
jgi:hypothetical protein